MDLSGAKWTEGDRLDQNRPKWVEWTELDRSEANWTKGDRLDQNRLKSSEWTERDRGGPIGPK